MVNAETLSGSTEGRCNSYPNGKRWICKTILESTLKCGQLNWGKLPLDWSSDAIEEYTIAFAYDYWTSTAAVAPGGPAGGASDYRWKDNISLLQEGTCSMPNLYLFRYKWDPENYFIGVMAQELLDTGYKNAVHKNSEGYYSVDYSRLGFPMMKISKSRI